MQGRSFQLLNNKPSDCTNPNRLPSMASILPSTGSSLPLASSIVSSTVLTDNGTLKFVHVCMQKLKAVCQVKSPTLFFTFVSTHTNRRSQLQHILNAISLCFNTPHFLPQRHTNQTKQSFLCSITILLPWYCFIDDTAKDTEPADAKLEPRTKRPKDDDVELTHSSCRIVVWIPGMCEDQ